MTRANICQEGAATPWKDLTFAMAAVGYVERGGRRLLVGMVAISGALASLQLSTSLLLLAVYDYALPTRNATAIAALTGLACALHLLFAVLELLRARLVCRAGLGLVQDLDGLLLDAIKRNDGDRVPALLDDVERVRAFLTGAGPCAALDALWLPAFLAVVFVLHPMLGLFASAATLLLAGLAMSAALREPEICHDLLSARAGRHALVRRLGVPRGSTTGTCTHADLPPRWRQLSRLYAETSFLAASRVLSAAALGKGVRLALQSVGIGLGALLVIDGSLGPGALFASSLMLTRTFGCLDGALAHWRSFRVARASYRRLFRAKQARGSGRDAPVRS